MNQLMPKLFVGQPRLESVCKKVAKTNHYNTQFLNFLAIPVFRGCSKIKQHSLNLASGFESVFGILHSYAWLDVTI